jgi:hypothetical protein
LDVKMPRLDGPGALVRIRQVERPKFMHQFYLIPLPTGAWGLDHPGAVIAVDQLPCVVGRHPGCDRRVHRREVSRRHCAFWLRDGRAWVGDLGSRNGTRLNGKPLTKASPLAEGDRLDLAGLTFLCLSRLPHEGAVGEAGGFKRGRVVTDPAFLLHRGTGPGSLADGS